MTAVLFTICAALLQPVGDADERRAFEFLVGTWELQERIDRTRGTSERGTDRYVFEQPIRGGAITGRWRFNRGTEAKPDIAEAVYVSAYHGPSQAWSFYYASERSAQYWTGRKSSQTWYFYFDEPFEYEGRTAIQRQWWEPSGSNQIKRHFENSYDGGKTWTLVMTAVLRRMQDQ
jgi:hypothetical protein